MFLMYVLENQKVLNIVMQDQFEIIGTIINTIISIYDLFIIKFLHIFSEGTVKPKKKAIVIPL